MFRGKLLNLGILVSLLTLLTVGKAKALSPTSFSPADNATGVSVSSNLVITFDESWYFQTCMWGFDGYIYLKKTSDNSTVESYLFSDGCINSSNVTGEGTSTLTINPSSNLTGNTGYYITMDTILTNAGQDEYYGIASSTTWNFTTEIPDSTPPTVSSFSPADNATGVTLGSNLVITFSEAVDLQTGSIYIKRTTGDTTVESFNVASSSAITGNGTTTITINPTYSLPNNTSLYVQIDASAVDDLAANSYAGISNTTTWNFTTENDTSAPTVSSFSPADNSSSFFPQSNLIITFNEDIDIQTGNIYIKKTSDDSTVQTISVSSGAVTGNGTTQITINPSSNLDYNTGYYVQIDATAFDDSVGNSYAGISNTTTWNFTTVASDPASWYNSGWGYRLKITINGDMVNGTQANFPVYIDLSTMPSSFFDNCTNNGTDIRITKSNGTTEVAREVVYVDKTNKIGELHFVANGSLTQGTDASFWIYYGNGDATEPSASATFGKNNTWINGYAGVWHLHENPAGTAPQVKNSTSNSLDGTSAGSMTSGDLVTGKLGKAVDFGPGGKLTMSVWFKSSASFPSSEKMIFEHSAWSASDTYQLNLKTDASLRFNFPSMNSGSGELSHSVDYTDGNWNYISIGFDDAANTARIHYNGALGSSKTVWESISSGVSASYIACRNNASHYVEAQLDEFRLSSVFRSNSWIRTEYRNQNSPSTFYTVGSEYIYSSGGGGGGSPPATVDFKLFLIDL
jgi:methionine-rich copper-binding protein CopC